MIFIDISKAKGIAHDLRRNKRNEEFEPLDELIMKQVPGTDTEAVETQRQEIRTKYDDIQDEIENQEDDVALLDVLKKHNIVE